jgi:hypothetical protein
VNHRIFERTLRPLVFRGACLFERHYTTPARLGIGRRGDAAARLKRRPARPSVPERCETLFSRSMGVDGGVPLNLSLRLTSDQVGIPAELKHINKRRKRNQQGLP